MSLGLHASCCGDHNTKQIANVSHNPNTMSNDIKYIANKINNIENILYYYCIIN